MPRNTEKLLKDADQAVAADTPDHAFNYRLMQSIIAELSAKLREMEDALVGQRHEKEFIFKQVERGLFSNYLSERAALNNIAYWPEAPWVSEEWNWDVSHTGYADKFYKVFPRNKEVTTKATKEEE